MRFRWLLACLYQNDNQSKFLFSIRDLVEIKDFWNALNNFN